MASIYSATDVLSGARVAIEMLTGEVPFRGPNAVVAMNQRLLSDQPPANDVDGEIPPPLREIIRRALERDPARRYGSARSFARDLAHPEEIELSAPATGPIEIPRREHPPKLTLAYLALALIPVALFALLLAIAYHRQ